MIKITHHKRYENIKKERKEKNINLEFIPERKDSALVIETSYHNAYVFKDNKIYEVTLSKKYPYVINQLIYPGDKVILNNNEITDIIKRKNILSRDKFDGTKLNSLGTNKITATNIDLAIIVVAVSDPPLHPKFIDRYIILLENSHIPFIICFNKYDLVTKKEEKIINLYEELGYDIIKTSTKTNEGLTTLKEKLLNKTCIFVGNSGVGKSSLTNYLLEDNLVKTNNIGHKTKRGCHTTTSSKYYLWQDNSGIIDTPGIRSLDLKNFNVSEIKNYFKEFIPYNNLCKYDNCLHYDEPENTCAVKQEINKNITQERYESYYKIISEIKRK